MNQIEFKQNTATRMTTTKAYDYLNRLTSRGVPYCVASTGCWLSPDPINEKQGKNLYGFAGNCPVGFYDAHGQAMRAKIPLVISDPFVMTPL
jgi:RHS repeat-associated protein